MARSREEIRQSVESLGRLRQQHPAWVLLAARRGPAVLGCLGSLFSQSGEAVVAETAIVELAGALALIDDDESADALAADPAAEARREIRRCVRQGLIVERDDRLIATDALASALRFVESLEARTMTSTASRLGIVQREIERLEMQLSPDPERRVAYFSRQIAALEAQLAAVQQGEELEFDEREVTEQIREIHSLATTLHRDFRKVEDSYRHADQALRDSIISEGSGRGEIVDKLLDSHDALLDTAEGQVFDAFHQQLRKTGELQQMRQRLRAISAHPLAVAALSDDQRTELHLLYLRLLSESESVIRARSRGERDVKAFLRSGLAAEHHRVGVLLNELFAAALPVDWSRQALRRGPAPLPPVAVTLNHLNVVERLRFKQLAEAGDEALDLRTRGVPFDALDEEFWQAFDGLDRARLLEQTRSALLAKGRALTIGELAHELPPEHDLETLALWLSMALASKREREGSETVVLNDDAGTRWRFKLPVYHVDHAVAAAFNDDEAMET